MHVNILFVYIFLGRSGYMQELILLIFSKRKGVDIIRSHCRAIKAGIAQITIQSIVGDYSKTIVLVLRRKMTFSLSLNLLSR